jgi:peptide/nickel transport system ATP-binding protein
MEQLLQVRNLHVQYRTFDGLLKVLNGVEMTIEEAEKVSLVGETGCGKTTTIKSILQVLPKPAAEISAGQILYRGKDILTMRPREIQALRKGEISAIFQDPLSALNPVFTVGYQLRDIVRQLGRGRGRSERSRSTIRQRTVSVLRETGMPDPERILTNYPIQLSGGMRQRVCISEAFSTAARLLLADEPTTNLDVTIQDQILRRLDELVQKTGTSFLLISHSLGVVKNVTDRVYIMYAGNIVEEARTKELFAQPQHPYTKALLRTVPKLTGEGVSKGIPGRIPNYLNPPAGCRFHPRCGQAMPVCVERRPPFFDTGDGHKVACFLWERR